MAWQTLREIVEALDVAEYVDLYSEHPRFDEAWEALKWVLARNPEPKGGALKLAPDGTPYRAYVLAGDQLADTPEIWVVYTYTASQVTILGVQARPPRTEADEEEFEQLPDLMMFHLWANFDPSDKRLLRVVAASPEHGVNQSLVSLTVPAPTCRMLPSA